MKTLLKVTMTITLLLAFLVTVNSQTVPNNATPVSDIFPKIPVKTAKVWQKYIGQNNPANVPEIIDFSYAGYKQGSEIPELNWDLPRFNVKDYGAIPDDDLDDKQAIQNAIDAAAVSGGIVFLSPGKYDVFHGVLGIHGSNVIIRGCGASGSEKGGTTVKAHSDAPCFRTGWGSEDGAVSISGVIPKGSKYINLDPTANVAFLSNSNFIVISRGGITGDDWSKYSSRPRSQMLNDWRIKNNGISIHEKHEVDSIVGHRINLKSAITVEMDSNYLVKSANFSVGIGIEDLHIDHTFNESYIHLVHSGRLAIQIRYCANSFIRRVRISNSVSAFDIFRSYCVSAIGIIVDGKSGHYSGTIKGSNYCFVGLVEDYTDNGMHHGISVSNQSSANVIWYVGGPKLNGPDCHGSQPRLTLHDNYYSRNHEAHGSAIGKSSKPFGWIHPLEQSRNPTRQLI